MTDNQDWKPPYLLYTTSGCHLCEEAEHLLRQAGIQQFTRVDIAESPELVDRYGEKIPVLAHAEHEKVLMWPFSLLDLRIFTESH